MSFHDIKFFSGQLSRFFQNRVRNGNFSNIMHNGSQSDLFDFFLRHAVSQLCISQQKFGNIMNSPNMGSGFSTAKFNGCGQGLNHSLVQFDNLLRLLQKFGLLLLNHISQALSRPKQFHDRIHPPLNHIRNHRLADHIHNAHLICLFHRAVAGLRCNQKYRNFIQKILLQQMFQDFDSIHFRHNNIQQNGAKTIRFRQNFFQSDPPVFRFFYRIKRKENVFQNPPVNHVVVYNQKCLRRRAVLCTQAVKIHIFPSPQIVGFIVS